MLPLPAVPPPLRRALCLQVKLLEAPGLPPISIADFLGKAVEAPLQQAVTSAIQARIACCRGVACRDAAWLWLWLWHTFVPILCCMH
jgi:hypothetical protein